MKRLKTKISRTIIFLLLLFLAISNLYPLVFMFINSLKTHTEYLKNPFSLPNFQHLAWENYQTMISQFKIFNLFRNSFIISTFTILFILLFGIIASYAFSKLKFLGSDVIYFLIISSMFVPVQVTIIPLYMLFSKLHLVNTYWSVILTYLGMFLSEAILLLTAAFRGIPDELIEAAELDGAGYGDVIRYVIVPMGKPAIILCIIYY
ncbi:MAG: carbohydrate ABC transporter permease, partial [Anaerolineales bacterium]